MPKRVPWDALLEVIRRFPEGASLEEIMVGFNPAVPRRTLQRWLSSLVKENDLVALGKARARRSKQMYINGLLGIYELNQVELLRDVFVWAYEKSCALYSTTRKAIGEPDPFRMQYRNPIKQVVGKIVRQGMDKVQAVSAIRKFSLDSIPIQDQPRFIETVERELLSLHEGNIARFQLRPMEYENWKKSWQ